MINAQTKVGLFTLITIIAALLVVVNLGEIRLEKGYEFYVMFDDLADLPARPVVKISGVEVGRVVKIDLYEQRARVKIWIKQDVRVHTDTVAKILKMGMIGNTYIGMTFGSNDAPYVRTGDVLEGKNPISYEELIDTFTTGLDKVVAVFQDFGDSGGNLSSTLNNLKEVSRGLNVALGPDGIKLGRAIDNIADAAVNINALFANDSNYISDSISKLGAAAEELRSLLAMVREGKSAAGKVLTSEAYGDKIGETIDSIHTASLDLKEAVNRFKGFDTSWDTGVYYQGDAEIFRASAGLTFRTSSSRFLNLGLDNIKPQGEIDGLFDQEGDRINSLTLVAGQTFGKFHLYGGAIRSTGGFGADYILNKYIDLETEIFDFGGSDPWIKLGSKLKLSDFLNLAVYYEDILDASSIRTGLQLQLD